MIPHNLTMIPGFGRTGFGRDQIDRPRGPGSFPRGRRSLRHDGHVAAHGFPSNPDLRGRNSEGMKVSLFQSQLISMTYHQSRWVKFQPSIHIRLVYDI